MSKCITGSSLPNPIEAIKFRMEQPSDLADILGGRNRVSEVLDKKGS